MKITWKNLGGSIGNTKDFSSGVATHISSSIAHYACRLVI